MFKRFQYCFLQFLLCFLFSLPVQGIKIISPKPYSIVRSNFIKIQIIEFDNYKFDSVIYVIMQKETNIQDSLILNFKGKTEVNYSCLNMLDGTYYLRAFTWKDENLKIFGTEFDKRGIPFLIDRNQIKSTKTIVSKYCKSLKCISDEVDNISINNNDIKVYSLWNKDTLYFHFYVYDEHLNVKNTGTEHLANTEHYFKTLWFSDGVEISLDLENDQAEWKTLNDYELIVDVSGNFSGNRWDLIQDTMVHWGHNAKIITKYWGTINNNSDMDSGYLVTMHIPWTELSYKPSKNKKIGFDMIFSYLDSENGKAYRATWSGVDIGSNDNTSEWGTLIFIQPNSHLWRKIIVLLFITILIILIANWIRLKFSSKEMSKNSISQIIQVALDYIHVNYKDHNLSRETIAKELKISKEYLGTCFKKEKGIRLNDYIVAYRIKEAKELLKNPIHRISEIAFNTGFNTIQHFNRCFKKITGLTPGEYRNKL